MNKKTRYPLRWSKLYKNASDVDVEEEDVEDGPDAAEPADFDDGDLPLFQQQ